MVSQLGNQKAIRLDLVDDTVLIVYAARPVAGQTMLQRLRLSKAFKGGMLDLLDKLIDPIEDLSVRALPI